MVSDDVNLHPYTAGATTVAVSPFFLSPGRHWQEDIPTLVKEAADKHPGVG